MYPVSLQNHKIWHYNFCRYIHCWIIKWLLYSLGSLFSLLGILYCIYSFFAGKAKFLSAAGNKKWNILNCRTRIKNELWLSRGVTCHATTTIANNQQKILQSRDFYLWYYLSCCLRCWNWMCKVLRIDIVLCYMKILWIQLRYL